MTKAGKTMKVIRSILAILLFLFLLIVSVYWFNLDTRLVKALEKPLTRHYDQLPRDHRL